MTRPNATVESTGHGSDGHLVILGASTRALAESANRAGWIVHAADLFCDLDLREVARQVVRVSTATDADRAAAGYPWSLLAAADRFPASAAWCYTGALENHPDLVDAIAATRPLAGNRGDVLRRLRDPDQLAAAVRGNGLAYPETHHSPSGIPLDGSFLVKPLAGAGGRGIRLWTAAAAADHGRRPHNEQQPLHIWQRSVTGIPLSAVYCLSRGRPHLIGVSRQLIGEPWCRAGGFAWCGAVVIRAVPGSVHDARLDPRLSQLGDMLANQLHAVGLVGVDLMADEAGGLTVIEVNPRPTASMELFERSGIGSMASHHLAACGVPSPVRHERDAVPSKPAAIWAKAVLFTAQPTAVSSELVRGLQRTASAWAEYDGGWSALADIPAPDQVLVAGGPAITIFAVAATAAEALTCLRGRVAQVDAILATARIVSPSLVEGTPRRSWSVSPGTLKNVPPQ